MGKTVKITLHNGEEFTYSKVTLITDDKDKLNIYCDAGPVAAFDKGDIKTWHSSEEGN